MKSQIKQLTAKETFKPITLEIQIETLDELKILRGLWGVNYTIAEVMVKVAAHMEGISGTEVARALSEVFEPVEIYHESLK